MADILDPAQIEKELREINHQRTTTREQLDALRGRGRGRGDGRPTIFNRLGPNRFEGGPGPRDSHAPGRPSVMDRLYSQGSGRLYSQGSGRAAGPAADREPAAAAAAHDLRGSDAAADDGGPTSRLLGRRLGSRVVGPAASADRDDAAQQEPAAAERQDPAAGRKRLLSAVMVNGQARQLSAPLDRPEERETEREAAVQERPAKRPALQADDKTKRRAARMFGTLLVGTLQKFQNDEQAFKKSDTAQRRAELERRAQERAQAEAQRLRQEASAAWRAERATKLNSLHDLNLQASVKALELRYAKRVQQKQQLVGFCVTTTQPPLYWQPKVSSKESEPLLQESLAAFEAWKQQQLQELEAERDELVQAAAERREAALARLAAKQPPGLGAAAGDEDEEEDAGLGGSGDEGEQQNGDGDADADTEQQQQQHDGEQQGDEDMQEAAAGEFEQEEEEQEEEEEEARPVLRRPRRRGSDDEEEERLLSSDDEDA